MDFNFWKRKMPTPAPTPDPIAAVPKQDDELDNLQLQLQMARAQVESMEAEARHADAQLLQVAKLADDLKIRISMGDSNATVALNTLETEELLIRRSQAGLALRIATQKREIEPLQARANELAEKKDQMRQDEFVRDLTAEMGAMLDELETNWRRGCELAYDLTMLLSKTTPNVYISGASASLKHLDLQHSGAEIVEAPATRSLDKLHQQQIYALRNVVDRRLHSLKLARTNERWMQTGLGTFELPITPSKPKDPFTIVKSAKSA